MLLEEIPAALRTVAVSKTTADVSDRPLLLYCRPRGNFSFQDSQLEMLRRHYGSSLRVEVSSPVTVAHRCATWISTTQPTFLLLRRNQMLSAGIGRLTTRDLRDMVDRALN